MQMLMDGITELFREIAASRGTQGTTATEPPAPAPAEPPLSARRPAARGRRKPGDPLPRDPPTGADTRRPPIAAGPGAEAPGEDQSPENHPEPPQPPAPPRPRPAARRPAARRPATPHHARSPPSKKTAQQGEELRTTYLLRYHNK
jgi:hypothetical protein